MVKKMALFRWDKSEPGELFPYCRLLLTIESSDIVGRKQVAKFSSFCNLFSPDKTTLQNITREETEQEKALVEGANEKYKLVCAAIGETTV